MSFIGRERELASLEQMYQTNTFQMVVLYGRRRIGKTALLNEFCKDKNPLFYTGIESKDAENLQEFGRTAFAYFHIEDAGVTFSSWQNLLSFITSQMKSDSSPRKRLIIFDEYPYIASNSPELSSLLQREIDLNWNQMNVMLILCGSSVTFMEEEVLGEKSPLYGRRTGQIDLLPLDYRTSALFVPDYTPEEKAIVFGVTGGIPKYLSVFDPAVSLHDNLESSYFSSSGYFYEEPMNLLRQEFRDVPLYYAIVNAIGQGCTQVNEISDRTGFDSSRLAPALHRLESVRIVRKDTPILNEKNKKLVQYVLQDGMFRFWFRFVSRGTGAIERGYGSRYYQNMVKPFLHEYMGPVFEIICQEYTFQSGIEGEFGGMITRIGKWRGTDPLKHTPADIDVVGIDETEKNAVIGECKFRNSIFGKEEYETLLDRARLVAPYHVSHYLIFSLSGISKWVADREKDSGNTEYISMERLYS